MGLINLNGQRTCLPKLLCNAQALMLSLEKSVTRQGLMLIFTNRWIVMDESPDPENRLAPILRSANCYNKIHLSTFSATQSIFGPLGNKKVGRYKKKENSKDTHSLSRSRTQLPRLHVHCDRRVTNQYTNRVVRCESVTCRLCKHVSHVLTSNKGRHIVLDVSFAAVIALNLLRRAHDPQQR